MNHFFDARAAHGHNRKGMEHPYPPEQQLVDAAAFGDLDWLTLLLARGVDTEGRDEDARTPLHLAVAAGDREAVRALLEAGADANARDADGCTPLHHAARRKDLSMAYLLVVHGADVNARDFCGSSVLWQAVIVSMNSGAVVQFLRKNGALERHHPADGFDANELAVRLGLPLDPLPEDSMRGH